MKTAEFNIPSMTCESCADKIENALKDAGTNNVKFDFKTRNVTISFDENKIDKDDIKNIIMNVGYDVI